MTARDVLTVEYLGPDYQHKNNFKRRGKYDRKMVITKLTGFCHENTVTRERHYLVCI